MTETINNLSSGLYGCAEQMKKIYEKQNKKNEKNYCDIKTFLYKATIYILVKNKKEKFIKLMLFNVAKLISGAAAKKVLIVGYSVEGYFRCELKKSIYY